MEHIYFTQICYSGKGYWCVSLHQASTYETYRLWANISIVRVGNPPLCISLDGQENIL
jgi:hypothetical protein